MSDSPAWRVRVPASSANLGPGFDALGMALSIYLDCRFRASSALAIRAAGRDADQISTGEANFIWQTAVAVARDCGETLSPVELEIDNAIPLGKGLGSSAAALTVGVAIADRLLGLDWKPARIIDEAARLEGHPDNVAACVLGSIVASATDDAGMTRAVRIEMPDAFDVSVVVPDYPLPTSESRRVLPSGYSKQDATFNIQRAALLMAALAAGDPTAFPAALEDRLHQPYRAPLIPGLADILKLRAPGLLGCTLSGAGPSVLVLYERGCDPVCDLVVQIFKHHGRQAEVLRAKVARDGIRLERDNKPWTS
jgi:homoserine kinase